MRVTLSFLCCLLCVVCTTCAHKAIQLSMCNKLIRRAVSSNNFDHIKISLVRSKLGITDNVRSEVVGTVRDVSDNALRLVENNLLNTPILTKQFVAASISLSVMEILMNYWNANIHTLIPLSPNYPLQLWRYFTSSTYIGPISINFLRNLFILKSISSMVETKLTELNTYANAYLAVLTSNIIITSAISMYFGYYYVSQSIISSIVYLYSKLFPEDIL